MKYRKYVSYINRSILTFIIFIAIFLNVYSQENPIPLSFEEALRMALSDDPGLAARNDKIKIDEYKVKESAAMFNPRFDIYSAYSKTSLESEIEFLNPLTSMPERISLFPDDRHNIGISLSHDFLTFGRRSALKRTAELGVEVSKLEREEYKRSVYDKLARVFLKTLLTRDNLMIQKDNISRARRKLEIVRARMAEGLASDYDSIRAELLVSRYESDAIISEGDFARARASLKALLNLDQDSEIMPIGDLNSFDVVIPGSHKLDLEHNLDILKLDKSINIQTELINYHKKTIFPSISYFASYDWQNGYQPDLDRLKNFWTVGLSLNMNLFDGGGRRSKIGEARYESRRSQNLRSDLINYIKADIRSSETEIKTAENEIIIARKRLQLAEKGLSIAEARYHEGLLSISDLLDSELEKAESEIGWNLSLYRLALARLNFKSAAGYYPEFEN